MPHVGGYKQGLDLAFKYVYEVTTVNSIEASQDMAPDYPETLVRE